MCTYGFICAAKPLTPSGWHAAKHGSTPHADVTGDAKPQFPPHANVPARPRAGHVAVSVIASAAFLRAGAVAITSKEEPRAGGAAGDGHVQVRRPLLSSVAIAPYVDTQAIVAWHRHCGLV